MNAWCWLSSMVQSPLELMWQRSLLLGKGSSLAHVHEIFLGMLKIGPVNPCNNKLIWSGLIMYMLELPFDYWGIITYKETTIVSKEKLIIQYFNCDLVREDMLDGCFCNWLSCSTPIWSSDSSNALTCDLVHCT